MLYSDVAVTPEEEDELINMVAQKIQETGLDTFATIMIESLKPLTFVGANMGRVFISPLLFVFGDKTGVIGEKLFQVLENQDNVENLLLAIEKLSKEEEERKKTEKAKKRDEEEKPKTGWRRFISF